MNTLIPGVEFVYNEMKWLKRIYNWKNKNFLHDNEQLAVMASKQLDNDSIYISEYISLIGSSIWCLIVEQVKPSTQSISNTSLCWLDAQKLNHNNKKVISYLLLA